MKYIFDDQKKNIAKSNLQLNNILICFYIIISSERLTNMAFANRIECYVCDQRFVPRVTRRFFGKENTDVRDVAINRRDELYRGLLPVGPETRVCTNCHRDKIS